MGAQSQVLEASAYGVWCRVPSEHGGHPNPQGENGCGCDQREQRNKNVSELMHFIIEEMK